MTKNEMMTGERLVVGSEEFAEVAADRIAAAIERGAAKRGRISLALAGGSTPRTAYERLAERELPWERVEVFFGDERAVPLNDPRSNFLMAREALLDRVPVPSGQVHRMRVEHADREEAAEEYGRRLPGALDLIVLGVGEDGHTASLFPGSPALRERERKVVWVRGPAPPRDRLTVTPPVIESARELLVLVRGAGKAEAVARVLKGSDPPVVCPARLASRGTWILDGPAAARLGGGSP